MFRSFFAPVLTSFALLTGGLAAHAQSTNILQPASFDIVEMRKKVWYDQSYAKPKPLTLKVAYAADKEFLGADNPGYSLGCGGELLAAFKAVGIPCHYNNTYSLTMFLSVNGKVLFPADGKSNPYCGPKEGGRPDNCYIGTAGQNIALAQAVKRNTALFRGGDLTAAAASSWQ